MQAERKKDTLIRTIQSQHALALLCFTEFLPLCKGISAVFANMKTMSALMLLKFCVTSANLSVICYHQEKKPKQNIVMNFRHGGTCTLNLGKLQNHKY